MRENNSTKTASVQANPCPNIIPDDIVRISNAVSCSAILKGTANGIKKSNSKMTFNTRCYQVRKAYSTKVECWTGERKDKCDIVAVYRWDGMDFRCIWEREDFTAKRQTDYKYKMRNTKQFIGKVISLTAMFANTLKELNIELTQENENAENSQKRGGNGLNG